VAYGAGCAVKVVRVLVPGLVLVLVLVVVLGGMFAVAVVVGTAGAAGAPSQPLPVSGASLTQNGQDLVWQVELAHSFSPGALARGHQSLCLVIDQKSSFELCVAGPAHGRHTPSLREIPTGGGGGQEIAATITRSSDRELTASFLPSSIGLVYRSLHWQVLSSVVASGCTPVVPATRGCTVRFPAASSPLRLHTPVLVGCVASGPDWVFRGPSNVREIALTFDDGPWWDPPTVEFLRELERLHVPATFFEIGEHIPTYDPRGTVERQMLADGDMIGDHTWSHPDMLGLSAAAQRRQISLAAEEIRKTTGFEPCLFRAPDGAVDPSLLALARSMGFTTIQWDIDPRDWALPGESEIIDNVLENAQNGGIIEEHYGGGPRYETLDALPAEVAGLRKRGYQFVTLTQMLGYTLVYR
jgi:peptidoglycan/xylan/chitin deacetylase (PgdA/CDA1 family)